MSVDIALNHDTHDLPPLIGLIDGQARIRQQVEILLLTFKGEWFLDTTFGIPYFEYILIKGPRRAQVEAILRSEIRQVPGVLRIPAIDIKIDNHTRKAVITINGIETTHGNIDVVA